MKIREVLALTQKKRLSEIAKEHLNIGEKPAREALKNAGCYPKRGMKGWYFEGDEGILDKEIYEFTKVKGKANVTTKVVINKGTKEFKSEGIKKGMSEEIKEVMSTKTEEQKNERKRASFDLDAQLLKQLKIKAVVEDKNIYELVEQAIKEFLKKG